MLQDDIKASETYEKNKRRAMDRECRRNAMTRRETMMAIILFEINY